MKNKIKPYKIEQQRVWPFPNQIKKGKKDYEVFKSLHINDIKGEGKNLLSKSVISEFNKFAFQSKSFKHAKKTTKYHIKINTPDDLSTPEIDESYELDIDGDINISANSYVGAVYALMTLQQLIRKKGDKYIIENTPLKITDGPKIAFRSVMLDCARHFLPIDVLKKQVKAMAFNKLNHLHLHLTDGQSFPLALGEFTNKIALHGGAYSKEETYSKRDIQDLVYFAKERGVRVVPEIDTPGHNYSWTAGYPEMMTCNDPLHQTVGCCPEPPCGFFNIKEQFPTVQKNVSGVFNEVIDAFNVGKKGYGNYFHIGFDEVGCPNTIKNECQSPSCSNVYGDYSVQYGNWLLDWLKNSHPEIQTIMWIDQVLTSNFKSENQYVQNLKADPKHVVLQFWSLSSTTPALIKQLAKEKFRLINSQSTVYYLDSGGEGSRFYYGGPIITQAKDKSLNIDYQKYWMATYPGVSASAQITSGWPVSWEEIYLNNITWLSTDIGSATTGNFEKIPLKKSQESGGLIGASVCCWGEVTDETNLDQKLWPKTTAFAESLWKFNENRLSDNIINARYRITFTREDLLRLGIHATPVIPGDFFKNSPWGALNSSKSSLMYDINQHTQQIPEGYVLNFKRFWSYDKNCSGVAINPFCGGQRSSTMDCEGNDEPYPQQGC